MPPDVSPPERVGEIVLADGRRLGWAEWGPPDGVPVLLLPGAATSRRLGFGADVVGPLGVRLVSLDRPGLGASSPAPGRTFDDVVADVAALVAARWLGRPAVVGSSQGAPFALACAAAGVAAAVAVVSGADEVAHPDVAPALPADLRRLVDLVAADADAAEQTLAGMDAAAMLDLVLRGSPPSDRAVYEDPAFAVAYREALEEGFAQGPAGYARDTVLAMGRWPFDLGAIGVPVDLWYGAEDSAHSPDRGRRLAARIPDADHHLVDGIGGAVLWTHAEAVLRRLLARTGPLRQGP